MKKALIYCVFALFATMGVANAGLIHMNAIDSGDYFSAREIVFVDVREQASYESDFGLYSMVDPMVRYEIFSYNQEPMAAAYVSAQMWAPLAEGFGFYFDVHTGGQRDQSVDYNWFSDSTFNQLADGTAVDTDVDHVWTNLLSSNFMSIKLDDQLYGGDRDFTDMVMHGFGNDIAAMPTAPVPEPGTMMLMGTGLAGLVGAHRRRKKKAGFVEV